MKSISNEVDSYAIIPALEHPSELMVLVWTILPLHTRIWGGGTHAISQRCLTLQSTLATRNVYITTY